MVLDTNAPDETVGAALFCAGNPNADSFTIPSHALQALPRSATLEGTSTGVMWVGGWSSDVFDAGTIYYTDTNLAVQVDIN